MKPHVRIYIIAISSRGDYSRVASILFCTCSGAATIRERRLFESGVYLVIYGIRFSGQLCDFIIMKSHSYIATWHNVTMPVLSLYCGQEFDFTLALFRLSDELLIWQLYQPGTRNELKQNIIVHQIKSPKHNESKKWLLRKGGGSKMGILPE